MAINKVVFGNETLIDISGDTVTPDTLMAGATAHDKTGAKITGIAVAGGKTHSVNALAKSWTSNGDGSYQQKFTVSGITESTIMDGKLYSVLNKSMTNDEVLELSFAMANINRIITGNGTITLVCALSPPDVDINNLILTEA